MTWSKDGRELHHGGKYAIASSVDIHSLEISSCELADAGRYTCSAENRLGREETMCKVTVNGASITRVFKFVTSINLNKWH